jgi:chromosome segregation ATPase
MGDRSDETSFVDRMSRQGEEALGRLTEGLIASPLVSGAVSRAFEARERAVQAQEAAMGMLNIPSAADVERITRRLRSVSQRLEAIEDVLDRLEERLADARQEAAATGSPLDAKLDGLARDVAALRQVVAPPAGEPVRPG